jgi:hypothetical protein
MSSRATNAALKDMRDESAILFTFWGNPLINGTGQPVQTASQLERWREMTEWVAQDGGSVIFNEEANHITGDTNPCLNEALQEIGRLASLEEDWNDEGAPVIDRACILRAQKFVQWLACEAAEQRLTGDCAPAIFPSLGGGVKLYWKANGRQVALTFHAGRNTIEVMEKALGAMASHRAVTENEAGAIALEVMCEAV